MRVLQLTGSAVSPFLADLSRLYAEGCLAATDDPADLVDLAYVSPDGTWRFPDDLSDAAIQRAPALSTAVAIAHVGTLGVDVMVPQMFCVPGMTTFRALFDLLGIPFVGNRADVMALTADKAKARAVVAAAGVAVPEGELLRRGETPTVAPPVVVKPVDADNSHGVSLVRAPDDFGPALAAAFEHADAVLAERYVPLGREVRCGIVERAGGLVCLPLEEYAVDEARKPIRDAADKLGRDAAGRLRLVAKDDAHAWIVDPADPVTDVVWAAARRCHVALGCRDYSLFDFRVDPAGRPWFLEAGLYCSFAPGSVVATMARAAGIGTAQLYREALTAAAAR